MYSKSMEVVHVDKVDTVIFMTLEVNGKKRIVMAPMTVAGFDTASLICKNNSLVSYSHAKPVVVPNLGKDLIRKWYSDRNLDLDAINFLLSKHITPEELFDMSANRVRRIKDATRDIQNKLLDFKRKYDPVDEPLKIAA